MTRRTAALRRGDALPADRLPAERLPPDRATADRARADGATADRLRVGVLVLGLVLAVALRVAAGGTDVARSQRAGLLFALCLVGLCLAAGPTGAGRARSSGRAAVVGVLGGALVCLPVGLTQLAALRPLHPAAGLLPWAAAVTVVAGAEEAFLRGTLFDAVRRVAGSRADAWAVGVAAAAFALLHVPLYGWHVLPLDLAVGIVLGLLRLEAGSVVAPAVAHVLADLGGWFLR